MKSNMKQYDSYLIYGIHFPKKGVDLVNANSSLKFFNSKIRTTYNCEIFEATVPIKDDVSIKQYFLKLCIEQSDQTLLKIDKIKDVNLDKYKDLLEIFEMDYIEPYLIAIPIIRDLPSYA